MDVVLVGAPGSGTRMVGRLLAERHSALLVDLTGEPHRWADAVSGLRLAPRPEPGWPLRTLICADRIVVDPAVRSRLYTGRRVLWLDAPPERLVDRLRAAPTPQPLGGRDLRTAVADHLAELAPAYQAGTRIDASADAESVIAEIEQRLSEPATPGTLVLRAELHGGLIELGTDILSPSLGHVLRRLDASRCVVVTSTRHQPQADAAVVAIAAETGVDAVVQVLPDGEGAKRLGVQEELFRRLAQQRLERSSPIIALGDDSLLEAATFASAVWLRGVPLIAIPDTMLGMLDTGIGGKGGINIQGTGRNVLGAIHQPTATIIDARLVAGEADADRRAALAEAVKYGLLGDGEVLALLEAGAQAGPPQGWPSGSELLELVERCALAKRRLVAADERDTEGVRVALNLGHTLSHAIEAATDYRLRHGEAVGYGLRAALRIGQSMGVTPDAPATRAARLLDWLRLGVDPLDVPVERVLAYLEADKKRLEGHLRWVLVTPAGIATRGDVPVELVRDVVSSTVGGVPAG